MYTCVMYEHTKFSNTLNTIGKIHVTAKNREKKSRNFPQERTLNDECAVNGDGKIDICDFACEIVSNQYFKYSALYLISHKMKMF